MKGQLYFPKLINLTADFIKLCNSGHSDFKMVSMFPSHNFRPSLMKAMCSPIVKTEFMS